MLLYVTVYACPPTLTVVVEADNFVKESAITKRSTKNFTPKLNGKLSHFNDWSQEVLPLRFG